MASNYLRKEALSHKQKVLRFYKQAQREIQGHNSFNLMEWRYKYAVLRATFDQNRSLSFEDAKKALADGQQLLKKYENPAPLKFPNSPGGASFGRAPPPPDFIVDTWHPLEKAQYPSYFALRDIRKREFIERYEKEFGPTGLPTRKEVE